MARRKRPANEKAPREQSDPRGPLDPHSLYRDFWESLTPGERLMRSWAMRARLPDLDAYHDEKLFPRP